LLQGQEMVAHVGQSVDSHLFREKNRLPRVQWSFLRGDVLMLMLGREHGHDGRQESCEGDTEANAALHLKLPR
jgi:hypothetical protein